MKPRPARMRGIWGIRAALLRAHERECSCRRVGWRGWQIPAASTNKRKSPAARLGIFVYITKNQELSACPERMRGAARRGIRAVWFTQYLCFPFCQAPFYSVCVRLRHKVPVGSLPRYHSFHKWQYMATQP